MTQVINDTSLISIFDAYQFPYCINKITPNHPDAKMVKKIEKTKQVELIIFCSPLLTFFSLNGSIIAITDVVIIKNMEIKNTCQVSWDCLTIELFKYMNAIKITIYIII